MISDGDLLQLASPPHYKCVRVTLRSVPSPSAAVLFPITLSSQTPAVPPVPSVRLHPSLSLSDHVPSILVPCPAADIIYGPEGGRGEGYGTAET